MADNLGEDLLSGVPLTLSTLDITSTFLWNIFFWNLNFYENLMRQVENLSKIVFIMLKVFVNFFALV